jgi:alkyldihydroxyacetonephosphate synthase
MKRWRGWGNTETIYPLADSAREYLESVVGTPEPVSDITLDDALARVPTTRLQPAEGFLTDPLERLSHARGQSLPDWVAVHSGGILAYPDAVVYPKSDADLETIFAEAKKQNAILIPYGGGTSVVGHINPIAGDRPIICVDMALMYEIVDIDHTSRMMTFQAGVNGPELESQLNGKGYTLGHFPQSFEYSTLGGWVATRSVGQQCYRYGRVDEMFLGGRMLTPSGWMDIPALPASAAGPDLRQCVLGSEGRLGVISQATVRVKPLPQEEKFQAVFFPHWEAGAAAAREIVQAGVGVSMLRLADASETITTLKLAGKENLTQLAIRGLKLVGIGDERCLLIYGLTGSKNENQQAYWQVQTFCKKYGGFGVNYVIGDMWRKTRFLTPYLRNTLWELGYALDTLETCLPWSKVLPAVNAIKSSIAGAMINEDEKVLVFAHLSHLYDVGASTYITYLWRRSPDPQQTVDHWQKMKSAASRKIMEMGGTISHQHGVGLDHQPYLQAEKGELGLKLIGDMCASLDPTGMMNPGKLVGSEQPASEG